MSNWLKGRWLPLSSNPHASISRLAVVAEVWRDVTHDSLSSRSFNGVIRPPQKSVPKDGALDVYWRPGRLAEVRRRKGKLALLVC